MDNKAYLEKIPEDSTLGQYLIWVNNKLNNKSLLYRENYESIVEEEQKIKQGGESLPFLSIVTRTQGKRPEMLRETLLCLAGQEEQDFEIILIGHKLNKEQNMVVSDILNEQPEFLRNKIRFYTLDKGNRTAPLNFGFAHARGSYISILDDDDLVMDDWVSSFKNTARNNSGAILLSAVYSQDWQIVQDKCGITALRACDRPINDMYSSKFDIFQQMRYNNCPSMGFAFPSYLFHEFGLVFDETMETMEDWDYVMQCALIVGVKETHKRTAIYRRWTNAESSKTEHAHEEWIKNHNRILAKLKDTPVLIHTDYADSLSNETMLSLQTEPWDNMIPEIERAILYIDYGEGFNQNNIVEANLITNGKLFDAAFNLSKEIGNNIVGVRFDPGEEGFIKLKNIMILLVADDGSTEARGLRDGVTNGLVSNDSVFFLEKDPWIMWRDTAKSIRRVRVMGEFTSDITSEEILQAL